MIEKEELQESTLCVGCSCVMERDTVVVYLDIIPICIECAKVVGDIAYSNSFSSYLMERSVHLHGQEMEKKFNKE